FDGRRSTTPWWIASRSSAGRADVCWLPRVIVHLAQDLKLRLASLQETFSRENRGHCPFDSRGPRRRLLGRRKVVQVTPLSARRQRLEGALETRVSSEPLAQLLGNWKIRSTLRLHPQPSLLNCDGLAHVRLDRRRLRRDVFHAGELHYAPSVCLAELNQHLLAVFQ